MNGYDGQERRQDALTRDHITVRTPFGELSATGQFIVLILIILLCAGVIFWVIEKQDNRRELLEQEARLEVAMLQGRQQIIIDTISRHCLGLPIDIEGQIKGLEQWYQNRRDRLEKQKQK